MKRNMGTLDRLVRALLALAVGILYFFGQITGIAAIVLGVLAVVFLTTSLIGYCPLYSVFHLSTCKEKNS